MFVVVVGTILAPVSFTFTATVDPWITSPFVGVRIWTSAGLLMRSVGTPVVPPGEVDPEEHAPATRASTTTAARTTRRCPERERDPTLMWRHLRAPGWERRERGPNPRRPPG